MTPDQIISDIETVSAELARLRQELDRVLGRLADTELQLKDVRSERNHEHDVAEGLKAERDEEHGLVEELRTILANNVAIEQAIGIIAEKAHVDVTEARSRLKGFSRDHDSKMRAVAAAIVAGQNPKAALVPGDPSVAELVAAAGIPLEFWNNLTLNGAIFE